jgi:hypothetical protein
MSYRNKLRSFYWRALYIFMWDRFFTTDAGTFLSVLSSRSYFFYSSSVQETKDENAFD